MGNKERKLRNVSIEKLSFMANNGEKEVAKEAVNELIFRAKSGNGDATYEIVNLYEGLVYKHASRFFINGYTVEDLEQIGRCVILEAIPKFDEEFGSDFIFFISTNVKNKLGSIGNKKENREEKCSLDEPNRSGVIIGEILEDKCSIEGDFIKREVTEALIKVLGTLTKEERDFIIYIHKDRGNLTKYYKKHKDELSFGQVRGMKKRILKRIEEQLEEFR